MNTIFGVFDDAAMARRAVDALQASPLQLHDVSLVARNGEGYSANHGTEDVSPGQGAAVGAVWGGLVGLASLLIPGIGPFIAFGMLGAALTGVVTGAVVGNHRRAGRLQRHSRAGCAQLRGDGARRQNVGGGQGAR